MDKRRKLKNIYMKTIPPEITQPILDILTYLGAAFVGWVAKWLQRSNNEKKK